MSNIFASERKNEKPGKRGMIDYLVYNNLGTLLYTALTGYEFGKQWRAMEKELGID